MLYDTVRIDDDFCMMVTWAVRYCLGRRTYCVSSTCKYLTPIIPSLNDRTLCALREDINRQEQFGYGDDCDKLDWMNLLNAVTKEMKRRGLDVL